MYAEKFIAVPRRSTDARYSENVEKSHGMPAPSVSTFMSSTFSSVRAMTSWCSGRVGRDREAAVAGDDGRDAVEARRRERGVPEDLRVVVRVDVDEAGCDDVPARVELPLAVEVGADGRDLAVRDRDVGARAGRARAVDDGATLDDEIGGHGVSCREEPAGISRPSVWTAAREQVQRVGYGGDDHFDALERAVARTGQVADEGLADGAADAPPEHAERLARRVAGAAHRLGHPGCFAVDHHARALGREVAGTEPGSAGGDDEPGEAGGEVAQRARRPRRSRPG